MSVFCNQCGTANIDAALFCKACGNSLEAQRANTIIAKEEQARGEAILEQDTNTGTGINVLVVMIIVIALGLIFYFGIIKKDTTISDTTSQTTQLQKKCDSGDANECFNLGTMYYDGKGVQKDYIKAVELYQKACDGGDADVCNILGIMYGNGKGVKQDSAKAVELYQKACDGGNANGCSNLGAMYDDGEGVKQGNNSSYYTEQTNNQHSKTNNPSDDLKILIDKHIDGIGGYDSEVYTKFKNGVAEIVIYTVGAGGGGNNYVQYLIAKINNRTYRPFFVGGKAIFMSETISLDNDEIIINGMAYKESDAACCPTLPSTKKVALKELTIAEL